MLSSSGLLYFAEVARQGSFQGGADRLRVAVSAVSRQISLLERELGLTLFERSRGRRPLRLTTAGETLMLHVQELEASAARMQAEMSALRGHTKGHIRFGTGELFIQHRFPDALAAFSRKNPGVTFTIEIGSTRRLLELLAEGELDAGLLFNPLTTTGVSKIMEIDLANHALVPLDHPLANRATIRLSDLSEDGLALPGRELSTQLVYEEMFARARIKPRVVVVSNSYEMLVSAAMAGVAVALVNAALLDAPDPQRPGYRCVPINDPLLAPVRIGICVHEGRPMTSVLLRFIDGLRTLLDELVTPVTG